MSMEPRLAQKRRGTVSTACLRCHRRKQRCVGYPICGNCNAANVSCSRHSSATVRRLAGLSKEDLLKRIENLEYQASANESSTHGEETLSAQALPSGQTPTVTPQPRHHRDRDANASRSPSLPAEATATACRQEVTGEASLSRICGASSPQDAGPEDVQHETATNGAVGEAETRSPFLAAYLENMHRRVPFCHYVEILRTNEGEAGMQPSTHATRMSLIRLFMACAIGARVKQFIGTALPAQADAFLNRALALRAMLQARHTSLTDQAELALWLVLYQLRTSYTNETWDLIGSAMRAVVAADLHRERHYHDLVPSEAERHRLLFWAVYTIERNVCWAMKRPFSLADYDIDVRLPTPLSQPACLRAALTADSETAIQVSDGPRRPLDLSIFIASINLSRINSEIFVQTYRTGQDCNVSDVLPLLERLQAFDVSLPQYSAPDYDFLQLHVKNAVRILIEPLITSLDPSAPLTQTCLEAAGAVCRLFKCFRLNRSIGFSSTMVKSVFLAGMTICFIVSRAPSSWTPARANDLRACSSSLFAAAERNSGVRDYCETLDRIIDAASEYVEQVSSLYGGNQTAEGSPMGSQPDAAQTLRDAFDRLRHEFREAKSKFAFPSCPNFNLEPQDLASMMPSSWRPAGGASCTDYLGVAAVQWPSPFDLFNEALSMDSLDSFAAADHCP